MRVLSTSRIVVISSQGQCRRPRTAVSYIQATTLYILYNIIIDTFSVFYVFYNMIIGHTCIIGNIRTVDVCK